MNFCNILETVIDLVGEIKNLLAGTEFAQTELNNGEIPLGDLVFNKEKHFLGKYFGKIEGNRIWAGFYEKYNCFCISFCFCEDKKKELISGLEKDKILYIAEYATFPDEYYWYTVPLSILEFTNTNISLQNTNIEIKNSQIFISGQETKKSKETILDNAKKIIEIVKKIFSSEN